MDEILLLEENGDDSRMVQEELDHRKTAAVGEYNKH